MLRDSDNFYNFWLPILIYVDAAITSNTNAVSQIRKTLLWILFVYLVQTWKEAETHQSSQSYLRLEKNCVFTRVSHQCLKYVIRIHSGWPETVELAIFCVGEFKIASYRANVRPWHWVWWQIHWAQINWMYLFIIVKLRSVLVRTRIGEKVSKMIATR